MKAWAVFLKEWREMLRDQRVIFGVFIGPFLITVAMFGIFRVTVLQVGKEARQEAVSVAVHRADLGRALLEPLVKSRRFRVVEAESVTAGEELLEAGQARLLLTFTEDVAAGLGAERPVPLRVLYDPSQGRSEVALGVLREVMAEHGKQISRGRLQAHGVDPRVLEPFKVDLQAVAGRAASPLATMIPYFLMMYSLIGGMTIAADLVAGEKERGTMETLLTSPASRKEIIAGKFLALLSQAWVSLLVLLLAVWVGWATLPAEVRVSAARAFSLTPGVLLIIFIAILPYTLFSTSLLFAVSAWSRNQREAQGYLGIIMFGMFVPLVFGQFMRFFDFAREWWVGLLPVLNVFQVVHDVLTRQLNPTMFALTLVSMAALALLALSIAARMFSRESVLFRV